MNPGPAVQDPRLPQSRASWPFPAGWGRVSPVGAGVGDHNTGWDRALRTMHRRGFLKAAGALAAVGGLATPRLSLAADAKVLRFVPQANLANLDPIWGTQYVVRNASLLVWDTLYGVDSKLDAASRRWPRAHEASADGLTWTFKLRPA